METVVVALLVGAFGGLAGAAIGPFLELWGAKMSSVLVVRAIDRRILDLSPQNSVSQVRESWPIPATACRILLGELPRVLERHEAASAVTHPDTDVILAPHTPLRASSRHSVSGSSVVRSLRVIVTPPPCDTTHSDANQSQVLSTDPRKELCRGMRRFIRVGHTNCQLVSGRYSRRRPTPERPEPPCGAQTERLLCSPSAFSVY